MKVSLPAPLHPLPISRLWRQDLLCAALLAGLVAVIYGQVSGHQFVAWDDTSYVSENRHVLAGLSWENLVWAFSTFQLANWHPLTLLSHMLDVSLWGASPGAHALTSAALHGANVLLLYAFLRRLPNTALPPGSAALVAALWAAHPLHVESVAWISERKDVLCALFWLIAMHAYLDWASTRRWPGYLLTSLAVALALLAKPMAVTLPLALLCLDAWPLGRLARLGLVRCVLEKAPWLAMSAAVAGLTMLAQTAAVPAFSLGDRALAGLNSYGWYLQATVRPTGLHFYYLSERALSVPGAALALVALAAISGAVLRSRHTRPWLLAGWCWFLLTLLPVAGFLKVGTQAYADRYVYLPHLGLCLMLAGELRAQGDRWRRWLPLAGGAAVAVLAVASFFQVAVWQDTRRLYEHALRLAPDHYVAMMGLANLAMRERDHVRALAYADAALARSRGPSLVRAMRLVRGDVALAGGQFGAAAAEFELAAAAAPEDGEAHARLGAARLRQGQAAAAEMALRRAMELGVASPEIAATLGASLGMQERFPEAMQLLREASRRWPNHLGITLNLALTASAGGDRAAAEAAYRRALAIAPDNAVAREGLASLAARPAPAAPGGGR